MTPPSDREEILCAMFESFCATTIRNFGRNLKRAKKNRQKHDGTGEESVEYLISLLSSEDRYALEQFVLDVDGLPCVLENELLYEALLSLPDRERRVILYDFWYDWKDGEISKKLEVTVRTVYNLRQVRSRKSVHIMSYTGKDETPYLHVENEFVCFHTGLYTRRYKAIYGCFDRNKRKDSLLNWYFRGFSEELAPCLKYVNPLPKKPHYDMAQYGVNYNPGGRYVARYDTAKAKLDALQQKKDKRLTEAEAIGGFMFALSERDCELTEFDEGLWLAVVDKATAFHDGRLVFTFQNGTEIDG